MPRADVVAFLDIDDELLAPRFRADEQALGLLARAARLLGPRADGGRLPRPDPPAPPRGARRRPPRRPRPPAPARRWPAGPSSDLPPARALAVLSGAGAEELADRAPDWTAPSAVAGPADGRYLVRAADADALGTALAAAPRPPPGSASRSTRPACEVVAAADDLASVLVRIVHARGADSPTRTWSDDGRYAVRRPYVEEAVAVVGGAADDRPALLGQPAGQRVRAEVLVHHQVARRRPASSRPSQRRSSSWSAALPMRMGGLLHSAANRTSPGTSSGAATRSRWPGRSSRTFSGQRSRARSLTSIAQTAAAGFRRASAEGDRPVAAAEVEHGAVGHDELAPAQQGVGPRVEAVRRRRPPGRWPGRAGRRAAAPRWCGGPSGWPAARLKYCAVSSGRGPRTARVGADILTLVPREIRVFGDPVLKTAAAEVADIDGKLVRLADEMLEVDVRRTRPGSGRTAGRRPEAAVRLRRRRRPAHDREPDIKESRGEWVYDEGCLSIPHLYVEMVRPKEVLLAGWDLDGNEVEIEADELTGPAVPARAGPPAGHA